MKINTIKFSRTGFFEKDLEELQDKRVDKKVNKKMKLYKRNIEAFLTKSKRFRLVTVKYKIVQYKNIQLWQYKLDKDFRIIFIKFNSEIILLHIFKKQRQKNCNTDTLSLLKPRIESILDTTNNITSSDIPKLILSFGF